MTLKNWLDKQGFPHGMECVGEARLQQLWDAAQNEERAACAAECERMMMFPGGRQESFAHHGVQAAANAIRERSNVEVQRDSGGLIAGGSAGTTG